MRWEMPSKNKFASQLPMTAGDPAKPMVELVLTGQEALGKHQVEPEKRMHMTRPGMPECDRMNSHIPQL